MRDKNHGFTLIELLIVVAIIGILAAIAVPNFMNARIRSKVARAYADMKSLEYPIAQYKLDYGMYPASPFHHCRIGCYPGAITTPIAYMQSVPIDIFRNFVLELDQYPAEYSWTWVTGDIFDMSYNFVRFGPEYSSSRDLSKIILIDNTSAGANQRNGRGFSGYRRDDIHWRLSSAGPDQIRWRNLDYYLIPFSEPLYDPSNGIASDGNLYLSEVGKGAKLLPYIQRQARGG